MRIHIFNPEHDIALSMNADRFTPPHNVRQLRSDMAFLPSLWAEEGDVVIVDDVDGARERLRHIKGINKDVRFVANYGVRSMLASLGEYSREIEILPWGWDRTLVSELVRMGIPRDLLPSEQALSFIRCLSGRQWANNLRLFLPQYEDGMIQMPQTCQSVTEVEECHKQLFSCHSVIKSPWSCSGRGVRYAMGEMSSELTGWMNNVIRQQGCVVCEPYYDKVSDFAVELYSHRDGSVSFEGISLFCTSNGAYIGNIVLSEEEKWDNIRRWGVEDDLRDAIEMIRTYMSEAIHGEYIGPFGVDMMVLPGKTICPCVEINLRRTMGHVALSLYDKDNYPQQRIMRIDYSGKYHFRIKETMDNVINNSLI